MRRIVSPILGFTLTSLAACAGSGYAVRAVPRIMADAVGRPVDGLARDFGPPRRIDRTETALVYIWFLPDRPAGAPAGFHGCQLEVTVDGRSLRVEGYATADVGWSTCGRMERRIRIAER